MFRTVHQKVERFRDGRERQSDEDFLQELNLPEDHDATRVGLAVRRAVASVGLIDPLYIRADDREDHELSVLPLWDSMDHLAFLFELERELNLKIPDHEAEKIRVIHSSVRQYACDVLAVVQRLRAG